MGHSRVAVCCCSGRGGRVLLLPFLLFGAGVGLAEGSIASRGVSTCCAEFTDSRLHKYSRIL